jgi:hypothetical protein
MRKGALLIICFLVLFANSADATSKALHAQALGYGAFRNAGNYSIGSQELELTEELQMDSDIHRRILAGTLKYNSLNPNRPAGNTEPGQPYTGRPCNGVYHCPH